ncbi:hypothetical protein ACVI1J_010322 [Bradyrhizobium diazoefficiens]|jgi:hypothetical protein|uniref:Uncharacterized protein n=1 Tax=Bradyrhizobium barranii subsp. barranii TaxID=2823807 RepID=A0A939SA39_9BRAD|nr:MULTISPECIES: hypothetical protein [Bradyrhizobium]MBR0866939.1 hypothetical protein [Bradyrhizobium diazoefficiens]MBR0884100.1 hypothetical protein [Bradyrhizobium liaoningense]MBR0891463.1 hypothetical protein [Bradyrhizobium diazoefficiens]MBR0923161.1 hypothetical protein [Bradyrhizobium diazoefficiens]MBR0944754.1 hypothetical protein [Bradyrhizobium liaoningense]
MTRWDPSLDLACLLEALSEEILAATDEEVRETSGLQGWTIANTALEVRSLIRTARANVEGNLEQDFDQNLSDELGKSGAGSRPVRRPRFWSHNQRH